MEIRRKNYELAVTAKCSDCAMQTINKFSLKKEVQKSNTSYFFYINMKLKTTQFA